MVATWLPYMGDISTFGSLFVALELPNLWGQNQNFFPEPLLAEHLTYFFGNSYQSTNKVLKRHNLHKKE